jgi:hypothetical protein
VRPAYAGMRKATRFIHCLLGITILAIAMAASAETVTSNVPLRQSWVKRGVILEPGFAGPRSSKFVSSPSVVRLEDGRLRMYVWVADGSPPWLHGRHIVIAAESDPANPFQWQVLSKEAVGPDPASKIRDRGVGFPYVLPRTDGPWLMYFGTWGGDWTLKQELTNRIGLAVSHDKGLRWEVMKEDVLPSGPRGSFDAGAIPSVGVLQRGKDDYLMWYTAAERYLRFGEVNQGILNIGVARSRDGISWNKLEQPRHTDARRPLPHVVRRLRYGAGEPTQNQYARQLPFAGGNEPYRGRQLSHRICPQHRRSELDAVSRPARSCSHPRRL